VLLHRSKALAVTDVQARLRQVGALPAGGTPEDAARFHRSEFERWGAVVRATGAKRAEIAAGASTAIWTLKGKWPG
jgi:hypothetical protein